MNTQQIIMHFTVPPSAEDLQVIAGAIVETFPDELKECSEGLAIQVEEVPDETLEQELNLSDLYELVALFRSGKQIAPGVEKKSANDDDVLTLFRRPLLDMWCEAEEDLNTLIRQVMIEEIGAHLGFCDEDIEDMTAQHHQGML